MLFKLLSEPDKKYFLPIAHLLSLADQPLLWDGKKWGEATHNNLTNITIQKGALKSALLQDWNCDGLLSSRDIDRIEASLLDALKCAPMHQIEEAATRVTAVSKVFRALLQKQDSSGNPSAIKLMLFELMLLALVEGNISTIEYHFLNEFKHHHELDDFIFDDLLERAESTHREAQKTLALILE